VDRCRGGYRSCDHRCGHRFLPRLRGNGCAARWLSRRRHAPCRPWLSQQALPHGTNVPDLSALAGARAGTDGATLRTGTQDQAPAPRNRGHLGRMPPTSSWRSPASSSSRVRERSPRCPSPPPLRSPTPPWRSPAPLRCARPPLLTARWRAPPRRLLLCHLCGPRRQGWGIPPLGGSPPPIALLFLLRRQRILWGRRGREPLLLA
jgi:hypothetical protein